MNTRLTSTLSKAVLCAALAASLSGCVEMMVGSAVMGAVATADRRTIGAQTEDKAITVKAEIRLAKLGENSHVSVSSYNRKVLLTGEVRDEAMKAAAEREVRALDN